MTSEEAQQHHHRKTSHPMTSELSRKIVPKGNDHHHHHHDHCRSHHHIPKLSNLFLLVLIASGTFNLGRATVILVSGHPPPLPSLTPTTPTTLLTPVTPTLILPLFLLLFLAPHDSSVRVAARRFLLLSSPVDELIDDVMASNMTSEDKFKAVLKIQHRRYCQTSRTCLGLDYGNCGYCRPCRCDDRCPVFGDCCPDKLVENVEEVQPITLPLACRDNLYSGYTQDHRHSRRPNATSFLMTASCPPSTPAELARQCSRGSNYLPVSVPAQNGAKKEAEEEEGEEVDRVDVFANLHCAKCHGVEESRAVLWKAVLHCPSHKNFTSTKGEELAQEAAQDNDCILLYFPPPFLPSPRQCYYDDTMITSCNVTGAWPELDNFTERACAAYLDPKMAEGKLFQNVFCYICNSAQPELFTLCEKTPGIKPMPFSALIDFRDVVYGDSADDDNCLPSEIYDDTSDQCRPVLCAPHRLFMDGRCAPVFGTALHLSYSLYFNAILETEVDLYDENDLLHRLPGRLEVLVMFEMLQESVRPTSFQVSFGVTDDDGRCSQKSREFSVFSTFQVTRHVKQDDFEKLLLKLCNSSVSLHVNSQLYLNFTTKADEHVWLRQKNSPNPMTGRSCSTTVSNFHTTRPGDAEASNTRVTELLTLPKVALTRDEFHVQTADLGVKVAWLDDPIPLGRYESTDEGNVYIALEDFMPKITAYRQSLTEADEAEVILSIVCTSLSLAGLTLTLLTYSLFKVLRTAPGRNNMNLCVALFMAQFFYLVGSGWDEVPGLCQAMGILIHYFWLAAFAAMSVCSYHMWRVFTSLRTDDDQQQQRRRFLHYTIYIWVSAAVIVVVTLFLHMISTDGQELGYGGKYCYLSTAVGVGVAMGVPVALALAANGTCFCLTVRTIRRSPKLFSKSREDERHVWVYLKLSTLTGITWLLAFLVFFTEVAELSYLFTLVNGLQGVFVCLSFVCNRRVFRLYLACCKGGHPHFSTTTSANSSTSSRNGHVSAISRRTETSFTDQTDVKA